MPRSAVEPHLVARQASIDRRYAAPPVRSPTRRR